MQDLRAELARRRAQLSDHHRTLLEQRLNAPADPTAQGLAIPVRAANIPIPLSFAQQRIWFFDQFNPGNPAHHIAAALRLSGRFDLPAINQALTALQMRHAVLRTCFPAADGVPLQVIAAAAPYQAQIHDLSDLPLSEREARMLQLVQVRSQLPFDLDNGPVWRAEVIRLMPTEHVVLLVLHHIVCDGWSWGVLVHDLSTLYNSGVQNVPAALPPLVIEYADYAVWQRSQAAVGQLKAQLDYWHRQLQTLPPPLILPADYALSAPARRDKCWLTLTLPGELRGELEQLSRTLGCTPYMALLAAFKLLLYRYTHQTDVVVGTLIANRTRPEVEPLIGICINLLILRTDLAGQPPLRELVQRVRAVAEAAYANQDVPIEQLIDVLQPARDLHRPPLCNVLFVFQNTAMPAAQLAGLDVSVVPAPKWSTEFDLALEVTDTSAGCVLAVEYCAAEYREATIVRLLEHYQLILAALVANPEQRLDDVALVSAAEWNQICAWNATQSPLPPFDHWAAWFAAQVAHSPHAIAVSSADTSLTYAALNQAANRLAHQLQAAGVGPDCVVGLLAERGIPLLTGIIAVLKAGGAYLPLDPLHPPQRLQQIIVQSQTRLILADQVCESQLGAACALLAAECRPRVSSLTKLLADPDWPSADPTALAAPTNLAYVIYTSGSTGVPKGAMVEHQGMLNHLAAKIHDLDLRSTDRIVQNASQTFDISVWQFLCLLVVGGEVHLVSNEVAQDPHALLACVVAQRITILQVVPSLLRVLLDSMSAPLPLPDLHWIVPTGEALASDLALRWLAFYPAIPLMNAYGSTECSDDQCHHPIRGLADLDHEAATAIGRPLANTQTYILDAQLQPVPVGVAGELYIGGVGVGRGYLYDPQRTSERFVPDGFGATPGSRLYRSGDVARYRADGVINFLGRSDHQVKVRGFRIELGEIEVALRQHPEVRDAVVMAHLNSNGERYLTAYVALAVTGTATAETLRNFLSQRLAAYMVPAIVLLLPALPLSPNGKVDRRALPVPTLERSQERLYTAPRTPLETQLAAIWAQTLGVAQVGIHDDFFALGGSSLLAIQLLARVQQATDQRLSVASLFAGATIADQVALFHGRRSEQPAYLVPIRLQGSRPPLFLIHPVGGHVLCYHQLTAGLDSDQPVYGLQSPGVEGAPLADTGWTIADLAQWYEAEIRQVQPQGPYFLAGWSLGGVVAYELACRLQEQGEIIGALTLIDVAASHPPAKTASRAMDAARFALDLLATGTPQNGAAGASDTATAALVVQFTRELGLSSSADIIGLIDKDSASVVAMVSRFADRLGLDNTDPSQPIEAQIAAAWSQLQALPFDNATNGLAHIRQLFMIYERNMQALYQFQPRRYSGPLTLIVSSERAELASEPTLGWQAAAAQPIRQYILPGNHYTLLTLPVVSQVTALLNPVGE